MQMLDRYADKNIGSFHPSVTALQRTC